MTAHPLVLQADLGAPFILLLFTFFLPAMVAFTKNRGALIVFAVLLCVLSLGSFVSMSAVSALSGTAIGGFGLGLLISGILWLGAMLCGLAAYLSFFGEKITKKLLMALAGPAQNPSAVAPYPTSVEEAKAETKEEPKAETRSGWAYKAGRGIRNVVGGRPSGSEKS